MASSADTLLARMRELKDLSGAIGLLTWDQETYLPRKGEAARADQLATLQSLHHERLVDLRLGDLLHEVAAAPDTDGDTQAMIRALRWERDRAVRVPEPLVRALSQAQSRGLAAWRAAREARRYEDFRPALKALLDVRQAQADALGYEGGERYDALLEGFEPGMRVARLSGVLDALEGQLVPIANALCERPAPKDWFRGDFPGLGQWRVCERVLRQMGFDLEAGRLDKSVHPFTGGTHARDVRLTIRVDEKNLRGALYSAIHEGGHGLYEQGFLERDHRTPLAAAPSMGLHESQSRLWENMVGLSRPFCRWALPVLAAEFPQALSGADGEGLYRAANRVARSVIRVHSDELTYNLHILLRYQLELLLVRGELPLEDLAAEWNRRSARLLGMTPKDDVEGVLQDIHWAWGEFGYFPTYTLGNLYAASWFAALRRDVKDVDAAIERGELAAVGDWLRKNVHASGYRYPAEELVRRVTGQGLTDADFISYIKAKYGELYGLSLAS